MKMNSKLCMKVNVINGYHRQRLRLLSLRRYNNGIQNPFYYYTSPVGSLQAVKFHSEDRFTLNGKYVISISLILQWQDNDAKPIICNHWSMWVKNHR